MPRRSLLALMLAACAAALAVGSDPSAAPAYRAAYVGSYTWTMDDPAFGGFSGLELAEDGVAFAAISDRGTLFTGRLARDPSGRITGVEEARLDPLLDLDGQPVRRLAADPEGLAIAPDGRIFVSFEAQHRVWTYAAPGAHAEQLTEHLDFARFQQNSGLEALAIDDAGRLYALPERSGALRRPYTVYRWSGGMWDTPFTIPRDAGYLPVGADIGPDGRLYLLERDFRGIAGFFARVSRFTLGEDALGPRETLIETRAPFQNNFEGIAVWRDAGGSLRLTLLSDDNFAFPLTTEFADYRLID